MSDSATTLQRKLKTAEELQSVVRTMKALAGSNIAQCELAVQSVSAYCRTIELGLSLCFRQRLSVSPTAQRASTTPTQLVAVVFGSDQGLVGQFNELIADFAAATLATLPAKSRVVFAVGERVHARLTDYRVMVEAPYVVPAQVQAIAALATRILVDAETRSGRQPDELHLFFNGPTKGGRYEPVARRILPLEESFCARLADTPWPGQCLPELRGEPEKTLRALVGEYLFSSVFQAAADSLASENESRLSAMQRAEENIDQLLTLLHGTSNRLRQSAIDEELFDVIAGFEGTS